MIALSHLAQAKQTVSQIVSVYPSFTLLREKIEMSSEGEVKTFLGLVEKQFSTFERNTMDGVKVTLPNAWVHVRPSNTEPIVRIFVEAESREKAEVLLKQVQALV